MFFSFRSQYFIINFVSEDLLTEKMSDTVEELVQRAKLAEQAERYDDMAAAMKKVR